MRASILNSKSRFASAHGPQVQHPRKASVSDSQLTRKREVTRALNVKIHRAAPAGNRPPAREKRNYGTSCVATNVMARSFCERVPNQAKKGTKASDPPGRKRQTERSKRPHPPSGKPPRENARVNWEAKDSGNDNEA